MKRFRLSTLLLLVVIAALVTTVIVQSRRITELEAVAAPTLRTRMMVTEKRHIEMELSRQLERANKLKNSAEKNR